MTDSDKLSKKNQKILDNIEQSLQNGKASASETETRKDKNVATNFPNSQLDNKPSNVKSASSDKMTDNNSKEQVQKKPIASETKTTPASTGNNGASANTISTTSVKQQGSGGLWLVTIINFLLIAGVISAGYWYYTQIASDESQQQSVFTRLSEDINDFKQELSADIEQSNSRVNELQQALEAVSKNEKMLLEQLQDSINANAEASSALAEKLAEVSGRRPSDWLLAEANYLVNMAGRKLYLEKDIRTAITLLKEADARLVDLNDPSLFPVRALIAADVQTLNQINPTSTSSIALAIGSMIPKVNDLPLDTLQIPPSTANEDLTLSEDVADWRKNLARTWKSIVGDLITIDHVDEPLEPYLAERQQWLIEQQLKHSLSQAQSASLNEQDTLFKTTMQQAIALIVEHYKLEDTKVSQFLVALQELQNTDFAKTYPDKLESQASLTDLIKRRLQGVYNNQFDEGIANPREGNSL